MSALSQQHAQPMANNQMNILQRVVQAQDHPSSRPLNNLLTQSATAKWQRQLLRSGGSKLSPPGLGLSQGWLTTTKPRCSTQPFRSLRRSPVLGSTIASPPSRGTTDA
jgi:hypothetical protein